MQKKSSIIKLSDPHLFRQIQLSLPSRRRFSQIEARIILKQNRDRLFPNPKTRNFRFFLKLAQEAYIREEYNEAFLLINKTIQFLPHSSLSKYNLGNLANLSNLNYLNNLNTFQNSSNPDNYQNLNNLNNFQNSKNPNNLNYRNNMESMKGPNDLDLARIYELAGNIYKRNYRIQWSIDFLERSLEILINTLGEDTIYSQDLIFELSDSCLKNFRGTEAIFYSLEFLRLRNAQFPKFEEIDMVVMMNIGYGYYFKNGPKIASRVFREILKLNDQSLRNYNRIQCSTLCLLARSFSEAIKRGKAIKYHKNCLNVMKKCYFNNTNVK